MYFKVVDENGNEWFLYGNHNLNPAEFFRVAGGDITGRTRIKNKLLISQLAGFQDGEPSILLAIGDSDTGFHSMGDGATGYYSNGRHIFNMTNLWGTHNFDPNGKLNTSGGTIWGNLTVTGAFHSNNNVTAYSDARIKFDVIDIELEEARKLLKLKPKFYSKLGREDSKEYGVLAQDLEKLLPTLVVNTGHHIGEIKDIKAVSYVEMVPLLIRIIQDMDERIKLLEQTKG